jgi:diguanylate cyclase (GGDEF)-like protein/PAS domain S-box-containing protein
MSGLAINGWSRTPSAPDRPSPSPAGDLFARLFRASPVAILISALDDGAIIDVNDAFLRLFAYEREELIGRTSLAVGMWTDPWQRGQFVSTIEAEARRDVELTVQTKSGERRELLATFEIVEDRGLRCIVTQVSDVTERKRADAARKAAEERFRMLVEQLPVITYAVELGEELMLTYLSPQVTKVLGYTPEEVLAGQPDFLRRHAHPDDLRDIQRRIKRTLHELTPFRAEYRMQASDGRWVWIRDEAAVVRDDRGEPKHWQGVMVDVTEQRHTENALSESEVRFRSAFDGSAIGMSLVRPDGRFLRVNRAMAEILGYTVDELLGLGIPQITHPADIDRSLAEGGRLWSGEVDSYQLEKRYLRKDGEIVWGLLTSAAVKNDRGEIAYAIAQVQNITERKALESRLRELAAHDPLTGLYNRASLLERIAPALASTEERLVAVLFIDLDGFKGINDALGHHAGDLLLVEIGRRLNASVRAIDSVARLGGDELVVLLPGIAGLDDAVAIADRIVFAVQQPFEIEGETARVMASIGIAVAETGSCSVEDLLRQADVALYRAKAAHDEAYVVTRLPVRVGTNLLLRNAS